jgi:PKD repeat protein
MGKDIQTGGSFLMRGFLRASLAVVVLLSVSSSAFSQFNGEENTIFVTGQVTNNMNGAPISNHKIYVESDSVSNNGFYFYSTIYTDVNGFYYDTIKTTLNDGSIDIFLYDFEEGLHEATKYYRFNWSDRYTIVADFFIHDPNSHSTYQANFEATEDTLESHPYRVHFNDESVGFVIKSWLWDFGDGTYSEIQDPVHDFPGPGMYMVSLTISSVPLVNETHDYSTITKQVFVGLSDYYNIGGHVFTDIHFPIDYGLAYLYKMDSTDYPVPMDTTAIDTLGYYHFYQIIEGKYTVKTRLARESEFYGQFIPTYFGNSYNWEEASVFNVGNNNFALHVDLLKSEGTTFGTGQIKGQILYDTNTVTTSFAPAGNIEIILLDGSDDVCLTCNLSDLDGQFLFGELEYGTYKVFPDVTGIKAEPMIITISEDTPGEQPFNVVIRREQITFGIGDEPVIETASVNFWPNPVTDRAKLSFILEKPSVMDVLVTNQQGQVVLKQNFMLSKGKQTLDIDLGHLSQGIYQLTAMPANGAPLTVKMIKL